MCEFQAFGLEGDHQGVNAAMAIQLARIWCHEKKDFCEFKTCAKKFFVLHPFLKICNWGGLKIFNWG